MERIPDKTAPQPQRRRNAAYYIKSAVGLALMLGGQFLPPPPPITASGVALLGLFFGLIFLYAFVDTVWPNFAAMCIFAFHAFRVFPDSTQTSGIDAAGSWVFGCSISVFLFAILVLSFALEDCGLLHRLAMWLLTRKAAQKSPWAFSMTLLLAALILALFMDCSPVTVVMLAIVHPVFRALGFREGDAWPRAMVTCITWSACTGFWMTPIGHDIAAMFLGMTAALTGESVNYFSYMLVGIPLGLVVFALIFCYLRFVMRPDVSRFRDLDLSVLESLRPGRMERKERWTAILCSAVLVLLVLPSMLETFAPGSAPARLFSSVLTPTYITYAAIALMALLRVEGEPLLDLPKACAHIAWPILFLVGTVVMVATGLNEPGTGIPQWVAENLAPLLGGPGPYLTFAVIAVAAVLLCNIVNNLAVGAILCAVCAPLCGSGKLSTAVLAVTISVCCQMCYTTPAAIPTIAFATGDSYCDSGFVLRHGAVMALMAALIIGVLLYPLASWIL